jgi:phospholipid/cholesterol/gamma-HCH transport system permease protein
MTVSDSSGSPATVRGETDAEGRLVLRLAGRLDAQHSGGIWAQALRLARRAAGKRVIVDAQGVTYCDGAGIALLVDLRRAVARRGGELELRDLADQYKPLLDLFRARDFDEQDHRPRRRPGIVEQAGRNTAAFVADTLSLVAFVGEIVAALGFALLHPRSVRMRDCLQAAHAVGANALPVVALIGLLIGLVIGFQSAVQLRLFGGETFLAPLIGKSMLRELGPLMTAVVLTARSGSAFAAEIGTMKVNEEINALTTMGIDPVRFLVTPRAVAAVLMTPLLTAFANLAGIIGGAVVAVATLELPLRVYTSGLEEWLTMRDFAGGMVKAIVFGALIAGVGCIRGLQTATGAAAVGLSATRAVVAGIVLIVVADSAFSILYYHLDI